MTQTKTPQEEMAHGIQLVLELANMENAMRHSAERMAFDKIWNAVRAADREDLNLRGFSTNDMVETLEFVHSRSHGVQRFLATKCLKSVLASDEWLRAAWISKPMAGFLDGSPDLTKRVSQIDQEAVIRRALLEGVDAMRLCSWVFPPDRRSPKYQTAMAGFGSFRAGMDWFLLSGDTDRGAVDRILSSFEKDIQSISIFLRSMFEAGDIHKPAIAEIAMKFQVYSQEWQRVAGNLSLDHVRPPSVETPSSVRKHAGRDESGLMISGPAHEQPMFPTVSDGLMVSGAMSDAHPMRHANSSASARRTLTTRRGTQTSSVGPGASRRRGSRPMSTTASLRSGGSTTARRRGTAGRRGSGGPSLHGAVLRRTPDAASRRQEVEKEQAMDSTADSEAAEPWHRLVTGLWMQRGQVDWFGTTFRHELSLEME